MNLTNSNEGGKESKRKKIPRREIQKKKSKKVFLSGILITFFGKQKSFFLIWLFFFSVVGFQSLLHSLLMHLHGPITSSHSSIRKRRRKRTFLLQIFSSLFFFFYFCFSSCSLILLSSSLFSSASLRFFFFFADHFSLRLRCSLLHLSLPFPLISFLLYSLLFLFLDISFPFVVTIRC